MVKNPILKWMLLLAGILSTALAVLGILLPLLPTTPFLLLAAACFVRGSDRLYQRLITSKLLGPYILNYRENRGMSRCAKTVILTVLWCSLSISMILAVKSTVIRLTLLIIGLGVTLYVVSISKPQPDNDHGAE